ncbi:MAG: ATP-binding protein [Pseudomonadota bacterium]
MSNHIPSSGERAAIVGYSAQYRISAEKIYTALLAGQLEWIALADPVAGRVDDIQVATSGKIDAYQIKWGEQVGSLSFNDLTTGEGDPGNSGSHGLIGQLAGGWRRLKASNPGRRVVVHLVSRDIGAPRAAIPHGDSMVSKANLQGFLTDCWTDRDWTRRGLQACPSGWRLAMEELIRACGLTEPEFMAFVQDCELDWAYKLSEIPATPSREVLRQQEDLEALIAFLFQRVGADRRVIRIDRDQLLDGLGWETRFKPRFLHEFPINRLYQPISATVAELEAALTGLRRGYLAVLGTPGSGKSTTLTHTLRYRKGYRLVRYYAYVPDSPLQGRGEASNFLHDVVLALQSQGICGGEGQAKTREEFLGKLHRQLAELHERWLADGVLTVILVDGLDHIEREQKPERSLLHDLPHPDTVPDGVIFILGSQTLELAGLTPAIKAQLKEKSRFVTMAPLTRKAVFTIVESVSLPVPLTAEQMEEVYRLSAGHPLALNYLLKMLADARDPTVAARILVTANPYQGHIDRDYEIYWQGIEQNRPLKELLAQLARLRVSFDPRLLVSWVDEETVRVRQAHIYFRQETSFRWHFFHNSFRQFLIDRTSRDLLDEYDASLNREYHRQLAELTALPEAAESQIWEPLYHHACAEEWAKVSALASQAYFRRQFYALRSSEKIFEDITLALRAAREQMDAVALFRLLLIEHELKERKEILEQVDILKLVLSLDGVGAVLDYVMDGNHLQIDQTSALNLCRDLLDIGKIEVARTLFEAAEPLDWLSGSRAVGTHHGENDLLNAWIRCAYYLRPLEVVLNAINTLVVEDDPTFPDTDQNLATEELRANIRIVLVDAIAQQENPALWADFRRLSTTFSDGTDLLVRLDFNICQQHAAHPEAIPALDRLLAWAEQAKLDDLDKVILAEYLLNIRNDVDGARQYAEGIKQPHTYSWSGSQWKKLAPFVHRIRLNRLLATLGIKIDPIAAVPDARKPQERGNVLFERHLVIIASLWGLAKRKERLSGTEIVRRLHSALRLFHRNWNETNDWTGWYEFQGAANDYLDLMIRTVAAHGDEALIALSDEFEKLWTSESSQQYWPSDRRHKIASALYQQGDRRSRFVQRLESLQQGIGVWDEVHERVDYLGRLAQSWCEIGETDRARALIPRMLEGSFGIYHHKDRQLQQWVDVLAKVGAVAPSQIKKDLSHFAAAVLILEKTGRGRGTQDAATELLALAVNINPARGWRLCEWLWENGGIQFDTGVAGLLLGALRTEQPPIELILNLARHLYIPFVPHLYEPLVKQLAAGCIHYSPSDMAHRLLDELNQTLQVKAWPNERPSWWRALVAGIRQAGGDASRFEKRYFDNPGEQDSSSSVLILKDGRKITFDEARVMVGSYGQLVTLFESIEKTDYFPWPWLLEPLIEWFTADQIRQISTRWESYLSNDALRNQFALRLYQLGHTSEALALLEPMLQKKSASGWDRHWDGGSRLYAFKGLIAIDPKNWRPRALKALIDDYTSEYRYPVNLIYNWEELTEILFELVPWDQLWPEFREHIYQLAEFSLAEDIPHLEAEYPCVLDKALLSVYSWAAKLPINEVRDEVHKGLCEIIVRGLAPTVTKDVITSLLTDRPIGVIQGLALLDSARFQGASITEEFSGPILGLCQSPDFVEREMARQLAESLEIKSDNAEETGTTKLPLVYSLKLPSIGNHDPTVPNHAIHPGEVLPDSTDPLEMIRPHEVEIEWLSRVTDIPLENLLERTVVLMRSIKPESDWNRAAEERIRGWLSDIGLKLAYNRQRPQVALHAISRVVAELADAGMLDDDALAAAYDGLSLYDWRLADLEPQDRPKSIRKPDMPESFSSRGGWANNHEEVFKFFVDYLDDGFAVVGELSRFKEWDWNVPTELRLAMVCHPDWPVSPDDEVSAYRFFPDHHYWKAKNYPILPRAERFPSLVVRGYSRQELIGASQWLAFNPAIAIQLGWHLHKDGIFRWVDVDGQIMVESRWWQDGPMDRQPPRTREITGEGWLVIASTKAQAIIQNNISPLSILRAVKRNVGKDDEEKPLASYGWRVDQWVAQESGGLWSTE